MVYCKAQDDYKNKYSPILKSLPSRDKSKLYEVKKENA